MGLKKTKIIATTAVHKGQTGKTAILALFFCLPIFYATVSCAAQNPASPRWSHRLQSLVKDTVTRPKLTKPIEVPQEQAPIFGIGGLPIDQENFQVPSPSVLEKLGYAAPSQGQWEEQQEELAHAGGVKNSRYAVPSWYTPRTGAGRFTMQQLLDSRPYLQPKSGLKTPSGLDLSKLSPQDWRDVVYPAAKLEALKPEYEAMLEKDVVRAQKELEAVRLNYEQTFDGVKKSQKDVEYAQERIAQFQKDKIAAQIAVRKKAEQAVAQEQDLLESAQELVAFHKQKQAEQNTEQERQEIEQKIQQMERVERDAFEQLDKNKKELAKAQEAERELSKKTPEGALQAALAAGTSEAKVLESERAQAAARLAEAQDAEKKALRMREQAAENVRQAAEPLERFKRAPLGVRPANVPELPKEEEPVSAPTIAIPVFNPKPGWLEFSWLWGENKAKTEERAEQHLQKLTDLLRYTYTRENGANPEVLAAIKEHIKLMDANDFSLSSSYRAQIEAAEKEIADKRYEKHLQELKNLREQEESGKKPKPPLPPFNPAQRRTDQTPEEYAQGHFLALLGQYNNAFNQEEKLKAQQAIKEHAAYMKKQKFAFAKDRQYAQKDKELVKSFDTWRDWLPSLPSRPQWTRLSYWWPGSTKPKPVAPKKINAPSSFAQLPVPTTEPGKTPEQNAHYYLDELLEHYRGSKALGILPNPLAASKIKAHIHFMQKQGYVVDKSVLRELNLEE